MNDIDSIHVSKYSKYLQKNKIGGEIFDYEFCSLWINKTYDKISDKNLEKINNFAQLIQKYGKKLILYVDSFVTSNISDLQKMNIEIVDIRIALQQLYPVEQEFANNLSLQKELFSQNSDKKSINHIIHCILHPDIPIWTRIDFAKPLILLHNVLNKPENYYCIFSDLDLMDEELYLKYIGEKKPNKNKINILINGIKKNLDFYYTGKNEGGFTFDYRKLTKEQYDEYMNKIESIDETNYSEITSYIERNLYPFTDAKYHGKWIYMYCIDKLKELYNKYSDYVHEKRIFNESKYINCVNDKILALDKNSIFTETILKKINKCGIIAQDGANGSENSFYIIKNMSKIKHYLDAIYIKEVAYFVMVLMNYFTKIYNDELFENIATKKVTGVSPERNIIDIYLHLYKKIVSLIEMKTEYNFWWDVEKINDEKYLNILFNTKLNDYISDEMLDWSKYNKTFNFEKKEYEYNNNLQAFRIRDNLICMLSEKSKFN
ncbi:hypothetical protein BMW23_0160 [Bodo saltans virus]|uniref:Uncharacterized protein n=1 Tax=Bodo saltans virus TaxID=2024608 RepID=A0A2H4UTP6_9VIRU|nr:hypothetical protein QJ851_gp0156 [Bodo saltans virus]ATZ80219.1 hypothetical protein BMW23_0160 [Bodo saltans virus]